MSNDDFSWWLLFLTTYALFNDYRCSRLQRRIEELEKRK